MKSLETQEGGSHYQMFQIQPMEYIVKNDIPYLEGNVIKYISRHLEKGGVEDLNKAIHYIECLKEFTYGQED